MVDFDSSILGGESPVYGRSGSVSFYFQGRSDGLKPGLPLRAVTAERAD